MSQPTPPPANGAAATGRAGVLGNLPLLPVVAVGALLVAGGAGAFVLLSGNSDDPGGPAVPTRSNQAVGLGPDGQPMVTTTTTAPATTTGTTQLAAGTRNPFVNPRATTVTTTVATTGGTGTTSSSTTTTTDWWRTTTTTHRPTTTTTRRTRTSTTTRPATTTSSSAPTTTTSSTTTPSSTTTSTTTTTTTTAAGQTLFSFESGDEGFAALNAPSSATVQTQTDFHTDGTQGLRVTTADSSGDWFFATPSGAPLDLSGYTSLSYDVSNPATGFSRLVFMKTGDNGDWCQGGDGQWVAPGSTPVTITVPFADLDCGSASLDLTKVQQLGFWLNTGSIDVDDIRAE